MARDELRKRLFAAKQAKSAKVEVFGVPVEIRQPTVKEVSEFRESNSETDADLAVSVLINFAYDPDSGQKVFEEGDRDAMMNWPAGRWVQDVLRAFISLSEVNVDEELKK